MVPYHFVEINFSRKPLHQQWRHFIDKHKDTSSKITPSTKTLHRQRRFIDKDKDISSIITLHLQRNFIYKETSSTKTLHRPKH